MEEMRDTFVRFVCVTWDVPSPVLKAGQKQHQRLCLERIFFDKRGAAVVSLFLLYLDRGPRP